jgi:ribonuclease VapC
MMVLDASALLAVLGGEPGADEVVQRSTGALLSTVNLAEVLQKAAYNQLEPRAVGGLIDQLGLGIVPFDDSMALAAADLWSLTRGKGLSLGDRACLALGQAVNGVALTLDRGWRGLDLPDVQIHLIER